MPDDVELLGLLDRLAESKHSEDPTEVEAGKTMCARLKEYFDKGLEKGNREDALNGQELADVIKEIFKDLNSVSKSTKV